MKLTRCDFIKSSAAAGAAAGIPNVAAQRRPPPTEPARLKTFSEGLRADRDARKRGLEVCLQRIRELEPSIHAWVTVQPERPTADGPLSEIPFGVKDIIETQNMATE